MSEKYPPVGHPLQKLAARLTELLDEDHWAECEVLLLEAWNTRPDSKPYKYENPEQVMQNVDSYSLGFHHGFNAGRERKE